MSGHSGSSGAGCNGRVVRSCLPINSWAGEWPVASAVDWYVSNAKYGSLDLFRRPFIVCAALSASPLLCGKRGLLVICSNLYVSAMKFGT